jgi:hypothetical protein
VTFSPHAIPVEGFDYRAWYRARPGVEAEKALAFRRVFLSDGFNTLIYGIFRFKSRNLAFKHIIMKHILRYFLYGPLNDIFVKNQDDERKETMDRRSDAAGGRTSGTELDPGVGR